MMHMVLQLEIAISSTLLECAEIKNLPGFLYST
jgi:hypothetical protein